MEGKNLKFILTFLHSFYVWDRKAIFMIIIEENLHLQKDILIENKINYTFYNKLTPTVYVEHLIFKNATSEYINEV